MTKANELAKITQILAVKRGKGGTRVHPWIRNAAASPYARKRTERCTPAVARAHPSVRLRAPRIPPNQSIGRVAIGAGE